MAHKENGIYKNKKIFLRKYFLRLYYFIKPFIPRIIQLKLRKIVGKLIRKKCKNTWPINNRINKKPEGWVGLPQNEKFIVVLRHDVESARGLDKIWNIIETENKYGFRSSFNFSPERYDINKTIVDEVKKRGFEVGLHGLKHDGKLYSSRKIFVERTKRINEYLRKWDVCGFVSPSTHHNYEWISELNILYDSSSFDTDPFEPQPDSVNTIFPFIFTSMNNGREYVELPYTLPQDSTLFLVLGEKDIKIWKDKIDWIVKNNGMVLLNTHPDYMDFDKNGKNLYPIRFYKEVLEYISVVYKGQYINYLPNEISDYWKRMIKKFK